MIEHPRLTGDSSPCRLRFCRITGRLACLGLLAFATAAFADIAATPPPAEDEAVDEYAPAKVSDPFEPVNRALFKFNDGFYNHALRPFAKGYEKVVPAPARHGLQNFFYNLRFPLRFVSCVLQGKPGRATRETGQFLINTTAGIGGFLRVSDEIPALRHVPPEDLGQTFGKWGVGPGPYLVLPLLGPSSLRDGCGLAGSVVMTPVTWSMLKHDVDSLSAWQTGTQTAEPVTSAPEILRTYDSLKQAAVDPYVSVRSGYLQYRAAAVQR